MSLVDALDELRHVYQSDFPDPSVAYYAGHLAALDETKVLAAVRRLIRKSRYRPTVSEILEEVAEAELALPSPEEAWDIACRGRLLAAPPEVQAAAEAVGGRFGILSSESPSVVRSQFLRGYAERRRNAILEFSGARVTPVMPPGQPMLGATMRALPETTAMPPRPIHARWLRRATGQKLEVPSEDEMRHAVVILRRAREESDVPPLIYEEAERVFLMEAGQ